MKTIFVKKSTSEVKQIILKLPETKYFEISENIDDVFILNILEKGFKDKVKLSVIPNGEYSNVQIEPMDKNKYPLIEKHVQRIPIEENTEQAINLVIADKISEFKPIKAKTSILISLIFVVIVIVFFWFLYQW